MIIYFKVCIKIWVFKLKIKRLTNKNYKNEKFKNILVNQSDKNRLNGFDFFNFRIVAQKISNISIIASNRVLSR